MRAGITWAAAAAAVTGGAGRWGRLRVKAWPGRRLARQAAASLITTLPQLRADMRHALTSTDRGIAVARWRSRWMLAAAMIDLVDPAAAKAVRAGGRRLHRHLMAVEVSGTAWPVGGIRRETTERITAEARCAAARWRI
ncbi:hypothetical protein GCM10009733_006640 [Nonomuraea maheshkhaliensis]|uniref:DUF222 domain-containing protein n=1 Tax=Nonomuraea maheshkhaliensis TaxID=419590 RepID=A0ABN2ENX0_9ACTN